tara:strand:- start:534 stop:1301 length:768 start_codon:yes stop_codon:yes gene_type:complete
MKKQTQTTLFKQERIKFLDNALLIEGSILVIADLHIGYEEVVLKKGLAPRTQLHEIITSLNKIFDNLNKQGIKKLDKIIILGDLKHEHGKISNEEWRETLHFLDVISGKCKEIILIKGNHDNILGPIAYKRNVKLVPYYQYKDILFMHGHKEYKNAWKNKETKILFLGHLHPAISLTDEYKKEKYKCFLLGKYKRKQIYVLPNFNPTNSGFDLIRFFNKIKNHLIISPNKLKNFNVLIYNPNEKQVYDFGKLKNL